MRRGYYMPKADAPPPKRPVLTVVPPTSPEPEAAPAAPPRRGEPLVGAEQIAARLGITVAQFYRLRSPDRRRRGSKAARMPVEQRPIGLVADGPTLDAWWLRYLRGEAD